VQIFRAYRDFFWRAGIDPTKVRPAAEALIRRILANKQIPTINTLVDAYNLASIKTGVALAAFDLKELQGTLSMRAAEKGEEFLGIGMSKPMQLNGGEIVVHDDEKLVAVYPYRDAERSKVTEQTKKIMLMVCGCPGIDEAPLLEAQQVASDYIISYCQGKLT
jgi:DNA/RNA-binding domain of Phe-tRNA-synthetase-like protein